MNSGSCLPVAFRPKRLGLLFLLLFCGWAMPAFAQVTANFTSNVTSGCSPMVVQFNDASTGPVTSWFWDFGNGTSTLQNPVTTYNIPGTYTVSLTVNGPGSSDTRTIVNYITVYQRPDVVIGVTPTSGCVPLDVNFSNNSIAYPGPIVSVLWDFGDGNTSTAMNPSYTYTVPGTYNVVLSVTDNNGCMATASSPTSIQVLSPIGANFSASPTSGCGAPQTVNFTDLSTGTGPFTYQWDFGDGNTSTAQNPSHTYLTNGTFTVTLIINNGNGCTDTVVQNNLITLTPLTAAFTGAPTQVCLGNPVAFTDMSTGGPTGWDWDFGDGNTSTAQNPNHTYAATGFYTVQLIVDRGPGCADTVVQTNYIEVLPIPTAAFTSTTPTTCEDTLTVQFTDLSTGAVTWLWDFGDGSPTSTMQNPSHFYAAPGTYTVTLTVTNAQGCPNTFTIPNYVQLVPPVAAFAGLPLAGCFPMLVNFTDLSTTTFGTITGWEWDFGDGNTSFLQNPSNTYMSAGNWTVTLIITTSGGCTDTLILPNYIQTGPNPNADFSATPLTVCYGAPIQFTDLSTMATAWAWDFGDGGTSFAPNPNYTYANIGCYTVTLTATNNGCPDVETKVNYVCVVGTRAAFNYAPAIACDTPATVNFTNTSTGTNLVAIWDFGDGSFDSTNFNPSHAFTTFGTFLVELLSIDTVTGCRDSLTQVVMVSKPVAGFTMNPLTGCAPLAVTFTDASAGGVTYQWDFGDGGTSTLQDPVYTFNASGSFIVQQIVTDINGCSDTAIAAMPIVVNDVVPDFSAAPRPTCPGTSITFTDLSTSNSALVSWSWDFGDATPMSNLQNPTHTYANPGAYTVTMTATDANGCSDTRIRFNYIVITRPNPGFTLSNAILCPGEPLILTNTSTGVPVRTYLWDFGDGSPTSTLTNPSHAYAANGVYPIQLIVTDGNGCQDSITQSVTIQAPVASFNIAGSSATCPPLLSSFTNTSTGNISSYNWDFGDGAGSTLLNPSHIYNAPGTFTVTLIVRTPTGCADTLAVPSGVIVSAPTATFTFDRTITCPGQPVQYIMSPAATYQTFWTFGDGAGLTGDTVVHAYSNSGSFVPQLTVDYLSGGCQTAATGPVNDTITVLPIPITAFWYSDTLLCQMDTVNFIDTTVYGGGPASFLWNFGDGSTDTLQDPSHFYAAPGTYTVTLSVTDTLGCSDADTVVAAVRVFDYAAGFAISDTVVCPFSPVTFTDTSFSDTTLTNWAWDFGDGNTATGDTVTHQYATGGWYAVTLVITTATGCTDTVLIPNAVRVQLPTGSFTISSDTTCPNMPLQFAFIGNASIVPTWYFGNGDSILGGANVTYAYPAAGTYTATVGMVDTLGCRDTLPPPFPVTVLPGPVAALAADSLVHCDPDSVRLWDLTAYASPAASVSWDFGDGNTGTGSPVTHYFAASGYYTITLAVTDQLGCTDTIVDTAEVCIHSQVADFGSDFNTGCLPLIINFQDSSVADTTIIAWDWLFGDGSGQSGQNLSHTYIDTGSYDVTLVITTVLGCMDTVVFPDFINIWYPSLPMIWAATVEGDNQVAVVYHQDTSTLFASYELWEETGVGAFSHISSEFIQTDTLLLDNASNSVAASTCYRPQIADICNDSTPLPPTTLHCTMELLAMSGTDQNVLTWSPYIGWVNVQQYDIFAVQDYDTTAVTYLGSVAGNVTTFIDNTVYCDNLQSYRVRAIGSVPQERSWSDSSAARPIHTPPNYVPTMVTATVLNNLDVTVEWDSAAFLGAGDYELFRSTDAVNWNSLGIVPSGTTQYDDQAANVGAQSYYYRVAVEDSCGYWTQPADVARSILLEIDPANGTADLSWNAYGNWVGGVDRYELEGMPLNGGGWVLMATLPANTLSFNDNQGLPGEPGTCYRVTAYESGGNLASSRSNELCFTMDIWVPNTVTPNGDGLNDVLIIRALAGYPGTGISIYNRWGNLVYEDDDYQNDWRGTNGNTGETLPDGTYFWVLHVSDGRTLKGYVTILR